MDCSGVITALLAQPVVVIRNEFGVEGPAASIAIHSAVIASIALVQGFK